MPSGFPGSIDSFTNPLTTSALNSPSHAGQHQDLNDAVNKIENYMGLVKVIPTSVTGGTLAANGTVTIGTAQSIITISNAFPSIYTAFKIIIANTQASISHDLAIRIGTDASANYYGSTPYYLFSATSLSGVVATTAGTSFCVGLTDSGGPYTFSTIDLVNPNVALFTMIHGNYYGRGFSGHFGGTHNVASAFSSVSILNRSGTLSGGTITIYGYRN